MNTTKFACTVLYAFIHNDNSMARRPHPGTRPATSTSSQPRAFSPLSLTSAPPNLWHPPRLLSSGGFLQGFLVVATSLRAVAGTVLRDDTGDWQQTCCQWWDHVLPAFSAMGFCLGPSMVMLVSLVRAVPGCVIRRRCTVCGARSTMP